MSKQKIRKNALKPKISKRTHLIILISLLILVTILGCFTSIINKKSKSWLFNYFNIVQMQDNLLVHFISVGQGDAIAINLPDDKVMVIDSGPSGSSSSLVKYLKEKVLNSQNDNYINYLVLTHGDADHIGGALNILKNFEVGYVFLPVVEATSATYKNLVTYINENNIRNSTNYSLLNCNDIYKMDVFGPLDKETITSKDDGIIKNSCCPVIKLAYKDKSFLFTGDIPYTAASNAFNAEAEFVRLYGNLLDSDVLKVAHHGSKYSSSVEFLQKVTPDYAIISVGLNNTYNHPGDETLSRLNEIGAKIYRTDLLGSILFVMSDDYGLSELDGDYTITSFEFNFLYVVIIVDAVLLVNILIVSTKKVKYKNA